MDSLDGPIGTFTVELYKLIDRWRKKTLDDQLTLGEVVGALEFAKAGIIQEGLEEDEEDEE